MVIHVIDKNDNIPKFEKQFYVANISEVRIMAWVQKKIINKTVFISFSLSPCIKIKKRRITASTYHTGLWSSTFFSNPRGWYTGPPSD